MVEKISEELKRLRDCYHILKRDYWKAVTMLGEYYHTSDSPGRIEQKFRLKKALLLKEFVESVPKEELPEIILIKEAREGFSLPVPFGKGMAMDMGVSARETEYYLPRIHLIYDPWPLLEKYNPASPKFVGLEQILKEKVGVLHKIKPENQESLDRWWNDRKSAWLSTIDPKKVDIIIATLEKHFSNSPIKQKLEELIQKIQEAESRKNAEIDEAEKIYYPLLRQRVSNLIDMLIEYKPTKYRLVAFIEYDRLDFDLEGYKEGRRKFFLLKEKKLISAPYKSFFGFSVPDLKKATDLPERQWLKFSQMLDMVILKPFLSKTERDYITTSEPWE